MAVTTENNEKWNFRTLLGQGVFVDVSFHLTSPRLVLPFLYMAIGAPVVFGGLILPIVQGSNMVSQLIAAPIIGASKYRKWYMLLALITFTSALAIIGIALQPPNTAWLALLFLVVAVVMGACQAMSSLTFQDLLGRILTKDRRNALLFTQATLAGLLAIGIALYSQRDVGDTTALDRHLELLWAGVFLAFFASMLATLIRETPHQPPDSHAGTAAVQPGPKGLAREFLSALGLSWFRRYMTTRALFLSVELATPFYAIHAASIHAQNHKGLGAFVIMSSLGYMVGGIVWQRFAKASIPTVMSLASIVAIIAGGIAIAADTEPRLQNEWFHAMVFFCIALAGQGVQAS
ncbi:MAG: hypothetical protein AAF942_03815, partial [Pseudomonadota bacterium]